MTNDDATDIAIPSNNKKREPASDEYTKQIVETLQSGVEALKDELGYIPYSEVSIEDLYKDTSDGKEKCEVKVKCSLCESVYILDEESFVECGVVDKPDGSNLSIPGCPECAKSINESVDPNRYNRPLNALLMEILRKTAKKYFGFDIVLIKSNIYASPLDIIRFKIANNLDTRIEIPAYVLIDLNNSDGFNILGRKLTREDFLVDLIMGDDVQKVNLLEYLRVEYLTEATSKLNFDESNDEMEEKSVESTENYEVENTTESDAEVETEESTDDDITADDEIVEGDTYHDEDDTNEDIEDDENDAIDVVENELSEDELFNKKQEKIDDDSDIDVKNEISDEMVDDDDLMETNNDDFDLDSDIDVEEDEISDEMVDDDDLMETNNDDFDLDSDIDVEEDEISDEDLDKIEEIKNKKKNSNFIIEMENGEKVINLDDDDGEDEKTQPPFSVSFARNNRSNEEEPIVEESVADADQAVTDSKIGDKEIEEEYIDLDSVEPVKKTQHNKSKSVLDDEDVTSRANHVDEVGKLIGQQLSEEKKWYKNDFVFEDTETKSSLNEFVDEEDLLQTFKDSVFGAVISEVYKRTKIQAYVKIDEETFDIPMVDFDSGVRVICIDCEEESQLKINIGDLIKNIPFQGSTQIKQEDLKKIYLYSDSLTSRKRIKAAILSLIKIINIEKFDPARIINLSGNYALFYCDNLSIIKEFEESNGSFPSGKPLNNQVALIAMRNTIGNKEQFTSKDIMNYLNKNYKVDLKSFNLYMVASARYIARPVHEAMTVEYTITDYTELAPTVLKDGFTHIIGAIIKEHKANATVRDPRNNGMDFSTYKYKFIFEFDLTTLPSPSLEIWYDEQGFIPLNSPYGADTCYIRKCEMRQTPSDGWRVDERLFLPIPLSKRFKGEIERSGLNVAIESNRIRFIDRQGYFKIYQPKVRKFVLNPIKCMEIAFDKSNMLMSKIDLGKFFAGGGVYEGGYDNILMQKFFMSSMNGSNVDSNTKSMMNMLMMSKIMK